MNKHRIYIYIYKIVKIQNIYIYMLPYMYGHIHCIYNISCCCFNMGVRCFTALRASCRRMAGGVVRAWVTSWWGIPSDNRVWKLWITQEAHILLDMFGTWQFTHTHKKKITQISGSFWFVLGRQTRHYVALTWYFSVVNFMISTSCILTSNRLPAGLTTRYMNAFIQAECFQMFRGDQDDTELHLEWESVVAKSDGCFSTSCKSKVLIPID